MSRQAIIGEARQVDKRDERHRTFFQKLQNASEGTRYVATFRLERRDEQDNPLQPITVELTSDSGFVGDLRDGDRVALYSDRAAAGGAIVVEALRNLTTGGIFGERKKVEQRKVDVPPSDG